MALFHCILCISTYIFVNCNSQVPPPQWVDEVHIVFSNHLDVGFNGIPGYGFATRVINRYFDVYFPRAIEIAHNMSTQYNKTFTWMTQSWLVSLYMNCPKYYQFEGMTLHCPNQSAINNFINNGVKKGIIYWHAFPFNAQVEVYDKSLFEFGLNISKDCSNNYGAPISNTLSQRDVPGMTKAVIPILIKNNITAISIGVNGGSAPAAVPSIFKWKNNNYSIIGMVHPGGYGGVSLSDAVIIPNFNHALVMAWNDDNAGPPSINKILNWYNQTEYNYPNATKIHSSSFTNFIDILNSRKDILDSLPVYEGEIGDSWNFGIQADPFKIAAHRIAQKYRNDCLLAGKCNLNDYNFYNFSRLLLKNGEHTFGGDTKKFLDAYSNGSAYYAWSNQQLREALLFNNSVNNLTNFRATWYEQRYLGLDIAVDALLVNTSNQIYFDLYNNITNDWNALLTVQSPLDEYDNKWILISNVTDVFKVTSLYNGNTYKLMFDTNNSGGISTLYDTTNDINYASNIDNNIFGEFIYQTLTETDFDIYINSFYYAWTSHTDYGKYMLNTYAPFVQHQYISAKFKNLYILKGNNNEFLVEMDFGIYQQNLSELYGGFQTIYNHINFNSNTSTFSMQLILINKTFSRIPESYYFRFSPLNCTNWKVNKMGEAIDIQNIIKNGSYHMHGNVGITSCDINKKYVHFDSIHSGLVAFKPLYTNQSSDFYGELTPFPTPLVNSSEYDGVGYVLGNQCWGTNYVEWYPFDEKNTNSTYLFDIYLP